MKSVLSIGLLVLSATLCSSQIQKTGTIRVRKSPKAETVVTNSSSTESDAEYPGGQEALSAHIKKNFHYPAKAIEQNVSGTVILRLTISAEGKITAINQDAFVGGGCDEEARRIVSLMPAWKPARKNGKNVESNFELPFVFRIK
jgi:TonB family protein